MSSTSSKYWLTENSTKYSNDNIPYEFGTGAIKRKSHRCASATPTREEQPLMLYERAALLFDGFKSAHDEYGHRVDCPGKWSSTSKEKWCSNCDECHDDGIKNCYGKCLSSQSQGDYFKNEDDYDYQRKQLCEEELMNFRQRNEIMDKSRSPSLLLRKVPSSMEGERRLCFNENYPLQDSYQKQQQYDFNFQKHIDSRYPDYRGIENGKGYQHEEEYEKFKDSQQMFRQDLRRNLDSLNNDVKCKFSFLNLNNSTLAKNLNLNFGHDNLDEDDCSESGIYVVAFLSMFIIILIKKSISIFDNLLDKAECKLRGKIGKLSISKARLLEKIPPRSNTNITRNEKVGDNIINNKENSINEWSTKNNNYLKAHKFIRLSYIYFLIVFLMLLYSSVHFIHKVLTFLTHPVPDNVSKKFQFHTIF